jgi:catechol 2,3-dioxygenase-like lactoylglutathione lyase family enzyme
MANTARHVGVVVKDLAKAIDFWANLIGFKLHLDAKEISPYIDELLGMKNPELRTVKLIDENGFILELLEFTNYPDKDNWEGNLDSLTSKLKQNNYEFVSNIKNSPNGLVKVVFVRGPEGLMLELVEELVKK